MTDLERPATCRLVYYSHRNEGLGPDDLDDILTEAKQRNAAYGITGLLAYNEHFFMQVLEGAVGPVNDLYADILSDPRHHKLRLISYETINDRAFPEWAMALAQLPGAAQFFMEKQFGGFNPHLISADVAREYLEILRDHMKEKKGQ